MSAQGAAQPSESRELVEGAWSVLRASVLRREPPLLTWAQAFRAEDGGALDFSLFPFQRELYECFGDRELPTVGVMKSAQCGISAAGVSLALYAADVWRANVLYVLPAADDADDFSDTRVKPAIESSPYLLSQVASTDNKRLKRIGERNIYFRGSGSEKKALSIPADVLIFDEYDRLDQRNVPKFRKRLGSPTSMALERRFSNPSFPEDGIHGLFLDSDQREWLVRCPKCRHQAPIYYDAQDGSHFLDPDRVCRTCRCGRALSPGDVARGRWVARHPGRPPGFHISKLIVPTQALGPIIDEHAKTTDEEIRAHYNFDLGLPYSPKGGSLDRETVMACRRKWDCPESFRNPAWITAGVDVGALLHVRITLWDEAGYAIPLYIGEIDDFDELGNLWDRYDVKFGLIDERPEERKAREFCVAYAGRAMMLRWSGEEQRENVVVDNPSRLVSARRSWACDKTVNAFTIQNRQLPRNLPRTYISQITAPHRVVETNTKGVKVPRYVSERADHYFFAETHDIVAKEARGSAPYEAPHNYRYETLQQQIRRERGR